MRKNKMIAHGFLSQAPTATTTTTTTTINLKNQQAQAHKFIQNFKYKSPFEISLNRAQYSAKIQNLLKFKQSEKIQWIALFVASKVYSVDTQFNLIEPVIETIISIASYHLKKLTNIMNPFLILSLQVLITTYSSLSFQLQKYNLVHKETIQSISSIARILTSQFEALKSLPKTSKADTLISRILKFFRVLLISYPSSVKKFIKKVLNFCDSIKFEFELSLSQRQVANIVSNSFRTDGRDGVSNQLIGKLIQDMINYIDGQLLRIEKNDAIDSDEIFQKKSQILFQFIQNTICSLEQQNRKFSVSNHLLQLLRILNSITLSSRNSSGNRSKLVFDSLKGQIYNTLTIFITWFKPFLLSRGDQIKQIFSAIEGQEVQVINNDKVYNYFALIKCLINHFGYFLVYELKSLVLKTLIQKALSSFISLIKWIDPTVVQKRTEESLESSQSALMKEKSKRQNHKRQKLQKFVKQSKEQLTKSIKPSQKLSDISYYLIELINTINCSIEKLFKLCKIDELSQISSFYFSIMNLAYLKFAYIPSLIKKAILQGIKLVILNSDYFNDAFYSIYINLFRMSKAHQMNQDVVQMLQQIGSLISVILRGKTTKSTLSFSQQLMNSSAQIPGQNLVAVQNLANAFILSNHQEITKMFPEIAQQVQALQPPNIHYRRPSMINDTSHLKTKSLQLDNFEERRSINYSPYSRNESANSKKRVAFTFENLKSPFSNVSDKNMANFNEDTKDECQDINDIPLFERVPSKQYKMSDDEDEGQIGKVQVKELSTEKKQQSIEIHSEEEFDVPAIY